MDGSAPVVGLAELTTLEPEDLLASRVFQEVSDP